MFKCFGDKDVVVLISVYCAGLYLGFSLLTFIDVLLMRQNRIPNQQYKPKALNCAIFVGVVVVFLIKRILHKE